MYIRKEATTGECYGAAMKITDRDEADEYFEALVCRNMDASGHTRAEAVDIERSNLAYYAGYCDDDTRRRVEDLFSCAHPIFGAIAKNGTPTPAEAFEMGKRHAANLDGEKEEEKDPII